jgi:hypothetical protein
VAAPFRFGVGGGDSVQPIQPITGTDAMLLLLLCATRPSPSPIIGMPAPKWPGVEPPAWTSYLDVATNQDGAPVFDGCPFTGNQAEGYVSTATMAPWGFVAASFSLLLGRCRLAVGSRGCPVDKGQWFKWENCTSTCGGNMPWDFAGNVFAPGEPRIAHKPMRVLVHRAVMAWPREEGWSWRSAS